MAMKRRKSQRTALYETATYLSVVGRVGANVRRLRHAHGWTQEECAFRCNDLGPSLLRTIEAGRTNVTAASIARLCDGLGVDVAELFVPAAPLAKRSPGRPRKPHESGASLHPPPAPAPANPALSPPEPEPELAPPYEGSRSS